jgi:hypothetical protein
MEQRLHSMISASGEKRGDACIAALLGPGRFLATQRGADQVFNWQHAIVHVELSESGLALAALVLANCVSLKEQIRFE